MRRHHYHWPYLLECYREKEPWQYLVIDTLQRVRTLSAPTTLSGLYSSSAVQTAAVPVSPIVSVWGVASTVVPLSSGMPLRNPSQRHVTVCVPP